jgi:hypothetical protein
LRTKFWVAGLHLYQILFLCGDEAQQAITLVFNQNEIHQLAYFEPLLVGSGSNCIGYSLMAGGQVLNAVQWREHKIVSNESKMLNFKT